MDQNNNIKQLALNHEKVQEELKLVSFEVYQEIMDKYVREVLGKTRVVAAEVISQIEKSLDAEMDASDKESIVGILALAVWADISSTLNSQIMQQSVNDEDVVQ